MKALLAPALLAMAAIPEGQAAPAEGIVVRFSSGSTPVEVTIDQESPAARDFLSMLPLTVKLEEFAGREKIAYLPRKLRLGGSKGSLPQGR